MLTAIPISKNDIKQAAELIRWIIALGGCKSHDCVIVADAGVSWEDGMGILGLAKQCFNSSEITVTDVEYVGWVEGANALWRHASYFAKQRNVPWLWIEPDAIPLSKGWLDAVEREYVLKAKPYMGQIYESKTPGLPEKVMSGVAVYPPFAHDQLLRFSKNPIRAWDMLGADVMVVNGAHTDLIHHLWGKQGDPPRFAHVARSGTSVLSLDKIKPGAVIFHRNKDGSLIRLLSHKIASTPAKEPIGAGFITVFPFHNGDAEMAIKNAEWIVELGQNKVFDAMLSYEDNTHPQYVLRMRNALEQSFGSVQIFCYPRAPMEHWPEAPNWAFQHTANHIHQNIHRPWLWLEYDAIPVKPEWVGMLQSVYARCGKRFMGALVKPMGGHMNGVGIYPGDFPVRCPKAMKVTNVAWDFMMKPEMSNDVHDAGKLIQHCWGIHNGMIHAFGGEPATFKDFGDVKKYVYSPTIIFHRSKDGTLIDLLRMRLNYEDPHLLQANTANVHSRAAAHSAVVV